MGRTVLEPSTLSAVQLQLLPAMVPTPLQRPGCRAAADVLAGQEVMRELRRDHLAEEMPRAEVAPCPVTVSWGCCALFAVGRWQKGRNGRKHILPNFQPRAIPQGSTHRKGRETQETSRQHSRQKLSRETGNPRAYPGVGEGAVGMYSQGLWRLCLHSHPGQSSSGPRPSSKGSPTQLCSPPCDPEIPPTWRPGTGRQRRGPAPWI